MLISLTLVFTFIFTIPAFAQKVYAITAITEGNSNVLFSNGYRGYCIDMNKHGATMGELFEESDTSLATSNIDGSDISGYLKALFVIKFDYLFVADGNGGYELDFNKKDSLLPAVIWNFSDNRYIYGEQKNIVNDVKAYDVPAIPDTGYTITLDNGDVITFYFLVMHPENTDTQDFFSYKIAVNEEETTTESTTESTESNNNFGEGEGTIGGGSAINPPNNDTPDSDTNNGNTTDDGSADDSSNDDTTDDDSININTTDVETTDNSSSEQNENIPNTNASSRINFVKLILIFLLLAIFTLVNKRKKILA